MMAVMCSSVVGQLAGNDSPYNMIPKRNRLTRIQVHDVLSGGVKKYSDSFFVLITRLSPDTRSGFSVIVGKKIAKSAVVRNRLRRAAYQGIGNCWHIIPVATHGIMILHHGMLKKTPKEITMYIEDLLRRLFSKP